MGTVTVNSVKIGDMKKETVKSYVDYNSKKVINEGDYYIDAEGKALLDNNGEPRIFKANQQTFYDLVMEVKSTMRIDGLTLNARLSKMFDNPDSEFQKSIRWKTDKNGKFIYDGANVDGKNPDAKRVLEIIRQYEQAAKKWVQYYAYSGDEKGDKPHFYEKELELAERLMFKANEYKGVSEQRIKYINSLTNGN
jgi:hypothetical protein